MDLQNLNDFYFSTLKNYVDNEMLPDYEKLENLYFKYFAEKNKTDVLKFIVPSSIIKLIETNLYIGFEECKFRINYDDYHDCEIVAISHSLATQTVKHIKHYTPDLMFLTIRPPEDMNLEDFQILITKLLNKDIITSCIGVWEQKGISYATLGQGKHVHLILKFNYNQEMKSHRQQIKQFLTKQNVIFDIGKKSLKKQFIVDKLYYMGLVVDENKNVYFNQNLKYKKTQDKIKCLEYDRIFTQRNSLDVIIKPGCFMHDIISLTNLDPP